MAVSCEVITFLKITVLILFTIAYTINLSYAVEDTPVKKSNWTFYKYLGRFKPSYIWDKMRKQNEISNITMTTSEELDAFVEGIDQTDELLKLQVQPGNPDILSQDGRRTFYPVGRVLWWRQDKDRDPFQVRHRLFELMKQIIYQMREKIIPMQLIRAKYRNSSIYRMGFVLSKTDQAVKSFFSMAFKAFRACGHAQHGVLKRYNLYEMAETEERLLDLWFDVDLMVAVFQNNDRELKESISKTYEKRKEVFVFDDYT